MTKSKKSSADIIGFPDRRSVEREIKSVADIASSARSALDQAQELIYDAWETPDPIEFMGVLNFQKGVEAAPWP